MNRRVLGSAPRRCMSASAYMRLRTTRSRRRMRAEMLELMRLMANGAMGDEQLACEFASEASECEAARDAGTAEIMRHLSRRHRIRSLELDAQLAAMRVRYTTLFGDEPNATL